ACGDDDATPVVDTGVDAAPSADAAADAALEDASDAAADAPPDEAADAPVAQTLPRTIGGDRPAAVAGPALDPNVPAPVLIVLHGFGASGFLQSTYFGAVRAASSRGMITVTPDGIMNPGGQRFWNATEACCDQAGQNPDDVAYIRGLIDELDEAVNIDRGRVYLLGHSNGGFMSYRMACDASDTITAIASLAGAGFDDPERCVPERPVSTLQMHGTLDTVIRYEGGDLFGNGYPSAEESASRMAALGGCDPETVAGEDFDFVSSVPGDEGRVARFTGCDEGFAAELWTLQAAGHIPTLQDGAIDRILDWLLANER
ncbi:MAG: alpha/beta hydrolase-fold protein, partial [Myxococcota bacterium]